MMVTEKGLHYFDQPPSQSEKKKKAKGSKTFLQGTELAVSLLENPDPAVHKDCKDTKFFYFGLAFRYPAHAFLMRVDTFAEKEGWVKFFDERFKRLALRPEDQGKDPPAWKASVDRILQQLSEEKEYLLDVDIKKEKFTADLKATKEKIDGLRRHRDGQRFALKEQQTKVALKLSEVRDLQQKIALVNQAREAAEAEVQQSRSDVEQLRTRLASDIERSREMEAKAVDSLTKTQKSLDDVRKELEELRITRDFHFGLWRKSEENYHERKPSTVMYAFSNPDHADSYSQPQSPTMRLQLPSRAMAHEVSVKNVPSVHWKSSRSSDKSASPAN